LPLCIHPLTQSSLLHLYYAFLFRLCLMSWRSLTITEGPLPTGPSPECSGERMWSIEPKELR
jgi:hypothetical protein